MNDAAVARADERPKGANRTREVAGGSVVGCQRIFHSRWSRAAGGKRMPADEAREA